MGKQLAELEAVTKKLHCDGATASASRAYYDRFLKNYSTFSVCLDADAQNFRNFHFG